VDGVDVLGAIDALDIERGGAEIGVADDGDQAQLRLGPVGMRKQRAAGQFDADVQPVLE